MAYTIVGPVLAEDKVAVAAALDASSTTGDLIVSWVVGRNLFIAYE